MTEMTALSRDFLTKIEDWLGDHITSPNDIELIVKKTGIDMGSVDLQGTPKVCWSRAVARIDLESRFHILLNSLALYTVNTVLASDIQKFSIDYDRLVANSMAANTASLQKELDGLINADEPRILADLSQRIRECVRIIRARIDDDALWRSLPFTTSGFSAEDVRDELSTACLRVVAATDGLIHETRLLTYIADDSLTQDPEASVRRRRQQLGAMTQAKLTLAERGRTLVKTVQASTPPPINPPNL